MPKIAYTPKRFRPIDIDVIRWSDGVASQYAADGYTLTLRQLYYQGVSQNVFPNREASYDRLGRLVSEGRLAGLIDWDHIVDRTRRWEYQAHWGDPTQEGEESAHEFVRAVMPQFRTMKWDTQPYYIEVWVEKEALVDVVARPARRHDLSYFAARGYASQSSQHEAAARFIEAIRQGRKAMILHLGDHDPSGIDMSRDIYARINLFVDYHTNREVRVERLALNMDQVLQYDPPPNPAKTTDSRFAAYADEYGESSWELDALDPPTIDGLITAAVDEVRDEAAWKKAVDRERDGKALLKEAVERWDEVVGLLNEDQE